MILVIGFSGFSLVGGDSDRTSNSISTTGDSNDVDKAEEEQERQAAEEEQRRLEQERQAAEEEQRRLEQERQAAEEEQRRLEQERQAAEEEQQQREIMKRFQDKLDNIQEFRDKIEDEVSNNVNATVTIENREKIKDIIKDLENDKNHQEIREDIRDELYEIVDYRIDLLKSKIEELGEERFNGLVFDYKKQIQNQTDQLIDTIRDKIRSSVLINQVEDGSYYGKITSLEPEMDPLEITNSNYVLSFHGDAFSTSDVDIVKSVSGEINLELHRLGDSVVSMKIIGGQIIVENITTEELQNVYDVAFGRSRINFDNSVMQVTINAVGANEKPHTFVLQMIMDGKFPTNFGETVDVYTSDGKSKSGTNWIFDFVGTLTVDSPIPISEFEETFRDSR